jgi:hypothetical protein
MPAKGTDPFIESMNALPISPETRKSYTYKVGSAMKACKSDTFEDMVMSPEKSMKMLEKKYDKVSTLKQTLTSVLATLSSNKEWCNRNSDCQRTWKQYHAALAKKAGEISKHPKSMDDDKINRTYVCWSAIMRASARALRKPDKHDTLERSMESVFLSMITQMPPKRSDFGSIALKDMDYEGTIKNYLKVSDTEPLVIVIGEHKTSKTHGALKERCSTKLTNVIRESLRRWPRDYLFVTKKGNAMSSNAYGNFVKRTMKTHVGKSIGTTMIRHIYISDVVSHLESKKDKKSIADSMLHSVAEQKRYVVRKLDGQDICERVK